MENVRPSQKRLLIVAPEILLYHGHAAALVRPVAPLHGLSAGQAGALAGPWTPSSSLCPSSVRSLTRECVSLAWYLQRGVLSTSNHPAQQQLHHFSSSPSSNDKPSIVDGWSGIVPYMERVSERTPQFERYLEKNVFPPENFRLQNIILFSKLQAPTNTEIDAVEFLNGAQFAIDLAMNTMYSREFVNFAVGAITESRAAETLRAGLTPACYDAFLYAMRETSKTGNTFELTQLEMVAIHLSGVEWDRMSLAEWKHAKTLALPRSETSQESDNADSKDAAGEIQVSTIEVDPALRIEADDHTQMVETLRLDVQLRSREHLDVHLSDAPSETTVKDSFATWRFESLVTKPEDIDWQIISVF